MFDIILNTPLNLSLKKSQTQVFSFEYCETFKNTFFLVLCSNTSGSRLGTFTLVSNFSLFNFFHFPIFIFVMIFLLSSPISFRITCVFLSVLIFLVKIITNIQNKKYSINKKSTCFYLN